MKLSKKQKGFTLIELLVVISIIGVLAGLGMASIPMVRGAARTLKRTDNLKQLNMLMMLYQQDWNSYPTVQPHSTRFDRGGGVADLYPLYATGLLNDNNIDLLQPPGAKLRPIPKDATVEDFNKNTIGVSYNSTATADSGEPLLADQGVSSGSLLINTTDNGVKPLDPKKALVLLATGQISTINVVNQRGKLSTSKIKADQFGRLLD